MHRYITQRHMCSTLCVRTVLIFIAVQDLVTKKYYNNYCMQNTFTTVSTVVR